MPNVDRATHENRKEKVFLALRSSLVGMTEAELEQETGIQRRTLNNYLRALDMECKVFKDGTTWIALPYDEVQLRKFALSPEEAMTLYLAARLFVKQHDKRNEPAETALLKLADVLTADAGVGSEIHQAARELSQRSDAGNYNQVFRTVMQAYIYRRVLRITYAPAHGNPFDTEFAPYLLEPSAIGYTTYAIGHSKIVNALRTYKLERIQSAALTRDEYAIPDDFPGLDILRNAWSIIHGEEVITVKLRFSPSVRARVEETRWHPSQEKQEDSDNPGYLLWQAQIADTTDMLPWVKGWGAEVEVLEPVGLREALIREAQYLAALYQVPGSSDTPRHFMLWAKANRSSGNIHRLIYHLIDVGQTALALWRIGLSAAIRERLAAWLGLNIEDAGRLIAFWSALHDIGKASPAFQDHPYMSRALRTQIRRELQALGLTFPNRVDEKHARHEVLSTWALGKHENLLAKETGLPLTLAKAIAQALGGHHGAWPMPQLFDAVHLKLDDKGDAEWSAVRGELIRELKSVFQPPAVNWESHAEDNVILTLLSGIISVADWLGSDEHTFGFESRFVPVLSYAGYSQRLAECLIKQSGWHRAFANSRPFDFQTVFGFSESEAQRDAIAVASALALPALVIIEMPMGSGKTEAALAIASKWARATDNHGLYVAMPTTATSNQMHGRAESFLKNCYSDDVTTLLVHSQAFLRSDADLRDEGEPVEEQDKEGDRAAALSWFLPRKRSLLAPFGVGTVDQALMSVLQTKHFFVRLLGLSHKVIIFDEVHAYDAYMSMLFRQLLRWLRELGTSVIVLSATLPEKMRREMVIAYTNHGGGLPQADYPRITLATVDERPRVIALPAPASRTLTLEWMPRSTEDVVSRLQDELRDGGCAAVICNTVTRAQTIYKALLESELQFLEEDLILFHARFPLAWRDEIEKKVLAKFGKDRSHRPAKAIVVATQVIEQSLDLDFDVMISDLCPADLLLQRAGRLHRHMNETRTHPHRLWIAASPAVDGIPAFDRADTFVYEPYVLLRSWQALGAGQTQTVSLPLDLASLVEQVYDDTSASGSAAMQAALEAAKRKMIHDDRGERFKAGERMIRRPDDEDLLFGENLALEEDAPQVHAAFQALTRSGTPGLQVVCLHQVGDSLMDEPEATGHAVNLEAKPSRALVRELARHTVTIQRQDIVKQLLNAPVSPIIEKALQIWKKIAALRHHRLIIFQGGVCPLAGTQYVMRLTREFGLEIVKET